MNPGQSKPRSDISVVQLAEAVIQGEVLIALQERGEAAPSWGYLNLLAHSDRRSLRRVRDFNQSRRPLSGWGTVVFDLIVDILNSAPAEEDLSALQRHALRAARAEDLGRQGEAELPPGPRCPCAGGDVPLPGPAVEPSGPSCGTVPAYQGVGRAVVAEGRLPVRDELRDDLQGKRLAQLDTPLVEAVDAPDDALSEHLVLIGGD